MLKKRLIPILLLQNGLLVRSQTFSLHQIIGNPVHEVERFNAWSVDEIIYLDITRDGAYDLRRDDQKIRDLATPQDILTRIAKTCFVPLTWGGGLRSIEDIAERLRGGADKVAINTAAVETPDLITNAAKRFGSQAVVVSIDAKHVGRTRYEVMSHGGRRATGRDPVAWAREAERLGAGEILLQSIDRDGTAEGYDLDLIERVTAATRLPVIACSGVGTYEHYIDGIRAGASAVAAANIWHFRELADRGAKRVLAKAGVDIRT